MQKKKDLRLSKRPKTFKKTRVFCVKKTQDFQKNPRLSKDPRLFKKENQDFLETRKNVFVLQQCT